MARVACYKEPVKLRTYQSKGTGLFYVISGAPCPISRADCFSRGFETRKEAREFAKKITTKWEELDRKFSLYTTSKLPIFFPDNGEGVVTHFEIL